MCINKSRINLLEYATKLLTMTIYERKSGILFLLLVSFPHFSAMRMNLRPEMSKGKLPNDKGYKYQS